jgi:tungstate transport system permease protein
MDFLAEGARRAFALLASGDADVHGIALLTLRVAATATLIACAVGLPLGYLLATRGFWGRRVGRPSRRRRATCWPGAWYS